MTIYEVIYIIFMKPCLCFDHYHRNYDSLNLLVKLFLCNIHTSNLYGI
jgi:hypothetical protein